MVLSLGEYPRVRLVRLPTPIQYMPRISEELEVELYIKRDDFMELAFGGNKARKLEYLLGDAIKKNCDTIITTGALCSNHVRLTAAACRLFNLHPILVLTTTGPKKVKGNLLLDAIFDAEIRIVDAERSEIPKILEEVAKEQESKGKRPYVIPSGGANRIGVLGYLNASVEILHQLNEMCIKVDYIVHSTGSGGTQVGLCLGMKALNSGIKIIGISCGPSKDTMIKRIKTLTKESIEYFNLPLDLDDEDIIVYDDYTCGGYSIVTKEVVDVIKKVAKQEAILLDPLYTGKAFMGLIDLVEKRIIDKGSKILFIHTGGLPLLFQYDEELQRHGIKVLDIEKFM
ncbi:MAG: D-cysteine desulfhydrase family protein [Candidatus Methanomethylicia archaeon]|nr:D-cysteine desulfhydrase family protein [Candidatus Methanomethylicia archaeon]